MEIFTLQMANKSINGTNGCISRNGLLIANDFTLNGWTFHGSLMASFAVVTHVIGTSQNCLTEMLLFIYPQFSGMVLLYNNIVYFVEKYIL